MLFVDSADKAARFIPTCNAFNVPLLFLADVPGLHDRHRGRAPGDHPPRGEDDQRGQRGDGAEDLSVVVRKAYGAGLYAMAGPAFEPDACLALPTASIAVMGPQAAVNAVFYNQLQAIEDPDERAAKTEELRREYAEDIDILHLASELVVDAVDPARGPARRADPPLRALRRARRREWPAKRKPITPV